MKISVVLCSYNGEKYIREQIESILYQTEDIDELLIFDDISTDGTRKVIEKFLKKSDKIKLHINNIKRGYALNFWQGLQAAKGDIVIFSDQDDIWKKDKVRIVKKAFIQNKNMLTLNMAYTIINENKETVKNYKNMKFKNNGQLYKIDFENFISSPRYPGMSMAVKKNILMSLHAYDKSDIIAHDWFLNQFASYKGEMYFLDKIVGFYRQHQNNTYGISSTVSREQIIIRRLAVLDDLNKMTNVLKKIYQIIDDSKLPYIESLKRSIENRKYCVQKKKILNLIIVKIKYHSIISKRDFLGDIYAIIR